MNGCANCKYYRLYSGSYYDPDDEDCVAPYERLNEERNITMTDDELDKMFDTVFGEGTEWDENEKPLCPYWEKETRPIIEYDDGTVSVISRLIIV